MTIMARPAVPRSRSEAAGHHPNASHPTITVHIPMDRIVIIVSFARITGLIPPLIAFSRDRIAELTVAKHDLEIARAFGQLELRKAGRPAPEIMRRLQLFEQRIFRVQAALQQMQALKAALKVHHPSREGEE